MNLLHLTELWKYKTKRKIEGTHIIMPRQIAVDHWRYVISFDEQKECNLVNQLR